ncbi:alginate export family protein [Acidicapsa acidisoli]|uniref:alginate export family protein n=1 Tax=Acidicapsa acidisoli TaxID=1615681 RepID=UPI0021DFF906|nr:alginate export family protein [Acidicapsa acidisoli]
MLKLFAVALAAFCLSATYASAQYVEYPQNAGKVQPLTTPDLPSWLTLDMDLRARTEAQTAIDYMSGNAQVYELTRVRGGMEIRPTNWLTGYIQFHDTHALGLPLAYTAANMRDNFDFRQAYLEFHARPGSVPVAIFAGRQELKFGDERLIGISDWTNNSRTFDGFDARIGDKNRIDLFSASVVNIYPTALDMHSGGLNYHGAYASLNSLLPRTTISPFVFIKRLPYVVSQQGIGGTETEVTPGISVSNNLPVGFDFTVEGVLQRGSYSNDSIHAGAGYAKVGYTATYLPWTPRLQGEYDYATGNPHTNPDRISTFDQQYPSSHNVFGLVDLFGWDNIKQARANLSLNPTRNLTLLIQQGFLWEANTHDGVYNGTGAEFLKPPTGGFTSDTIGHEFDASMKYVYHDYFVVNAGVGHFSPGAAMTDNAHGAPLTISYLSFTYRFKLNRSQAPKDQK